MERCGYVEPSVEVMEVVEGVRRGEVGFGEAYRRLVFHPVFPTLRWLCECGNRLDHSRFKRGMRRCLRGMIRVL